MNAGNTFLKSNLIHKKKIEIKKSESFFFLFTRSPCCHPSVWLCVRVPILISFRAIRFCFLLYHSKYVFFCVVPPWGRGMLFCLEFRSVAVFQKHKNWERGKEGGVTMDFAHRKKEIGKQKAGKTKREKGLFVLISRPSCLQDNVKTRKRQPKSKKILQPKRSKTLQNLPKKKVFFLL